MDKKNFSAGFTVSINLPDGSLLQGLDPKAKWCGRQSVSKLLQTEPDPSLSGLLNSQQGSFAIMFALTIMFVLTLLAFVLDTGFFLKEKNRYSNCAEAAAMAAVNNVCYLASKQALDDLVMDVVRGFNLDLDGDDVTVETGFYDAFDEYASFGEYNDFVARGEDGYPQDETWNAVMVTIDKQVNSMTGFQNSHGVKGAAVAFMPRVSMVSKDGSVKYPWGTGGNLISFNNGNIYGQRDVRFRNVTLADTVNTATADNDTLPESPLIENHLYSLETLIQKLKRKADKTYTMADQGKDAFYMANTSTTNQNNLFFDFTYAHDRHEIIFIDIPEYDDSGTPNYIYLDPFQHTPSGDTMKNMTIVTPCRIEVPRYDGNALPMGDTGFGQLNIISAGPILFNTQFKELRGVNFIADSFTMEFKQNSSLQTFEDKYMRVITTGNIDFRPNSYEASDFFFKFGPPCPPIADPALGILEPTGPY